MKKKKHKPLSPDDPMPFGKYTGTLIWQIMQDDPDYFEWLLEETAFELDDEGYEYYKQVMRKND